MRTYDERKEAIQKYQRSEKGAAALAQAGERWRARRRAVRVELKALMRSWDKAEHRRWVESMGKIPIVKPKEYGLPLDELVKVLQQRVEAATGWTVKDSQIITAVRDIIDGSKYDGHLGSWNAPNQWRGTPARKALETV